MATIASLNVSLTANSASFTTAMTGAQKTLRGLERTANQSLAYVGKLATYAGAALAGIGGVGLGIGVKLAADYEQAEIALTTMLGSAEAAKATLSGLTTFAASTPFEFPQLLSSTKQLVAYGFSAREIIPTLGMIGDVASGVGAPIEELAFLFGQSRVEGKLMTKDIRQFATAGVPIIETLARNMGVAEGSITQLASEGKIGFADLQQAFETMTGPAGRFGGMMKAQSQSIWGLLANLSDNVGITLRKVAGSIMEAFNFKGAVQWVTEWVKELADGSHRTAISTVALVGGFTAGVIALSKIIDVIKAVTKAYQALVKTQIILNAFSGPKGWALLAAGAAVAGIAVWGVNKAFDSLESEGPAAMTATAEAAGKAAAQVVKVNEAVTAMRAAADTDLADAMLGTSDIDKQLRKASDAGASEGELSLLADTLKQTETVKRLQDNAKAVATLREEVDRFGMTDKDLGLADLAKSGASAEQLNFAASLYNEMAAKKQQASITETVTKLQEQVAQTGLTGDALEIFRLRQMGATDAIIANAQALLQQKTAAENAATVQKTLSDLSEEAATVGMTTDQLGLRALATQGATEAELSQAKALYDRIDAQTKLNESIERGVSAFEATRTPLEEYQQKLADIRSALEAGKLTQEQAARAEQLAADSLQKSGSAADVIRNPEAVVKRFTDGAPGVHRESAAERYAKTTAANSERQTRALETILKDGIPISSAVVETIPFS